MSYSPPPYYPPPQPPPRRGRFVAWFAAAAVGAALVGGGVAVLSKGDDGPDRATSSPTTTPPAPSPSATVSEECRAWIRSELLDDSETIDATAGYGVCGDMSEGEFQAAVDEVTAELSAEITPEP